MVTKIEARLDLALGVRHQEEVMQRRRNERANDIAYGVMPRLAMRQLPICPRL